MAACTTAAATLEQRGSVISANAAARRTRCRDVDRRTDGSAIGRDPRRDSRRSAARARARSTLEYRAFDTRTHHHLTPMLAKEDVGDPASRSPDVRAVRRDRIVGMADELVEAWRERRAHHARDQRLPDLPVSARSDPPMPASCSSLRPNSHNRSDSRLRYLRIVGCTASPVSSSGANAASSLARRHTVRADVERRRRCGGAGDGPAREQPFDGLEAIHCRLRRSTSFIVGDLDLRLGISWVKAGEARMLTLNSSRWMPCVSSAIDRRPSQTERAQTERRSSARRRCRMPLREATL